MVTPRKKSPPKVSNLPPKPTQYTKSPPQDQEEWVKVEAFNSAPRPLLPPKLHGKKPPPDDVPKDSAKRVPNKRRPPPIPRTRPADADSSPEDVEVTSLDILGVMRSRTKLNGVVTDSHTVNEKVREVPALPFPAPQGIKHVKPESSLPVMSSSGPQGIKHVKPESSLPIMPLPGLQENKHVKPESTLLNPARQGSKPVKQPLLPPSAKPRKPKLETRKQERER